MAGGSEEAEGGARENPGPVELCRVPTPAGQREVYIQGVVSDLSLLGLSPGRWSTLEPQLSSLRRRGK